MQKYLTFSLRSQNIFSTQPFIAQPHFLSFSFDTKPHFLNYYLTMQLNIVKQNSLLEEICSKNGKTEKVHNVVKNMPFTIIVGSRGVDLTKGNLEARLIYNSADRKEVPFLAKSPLEYFTHFNASGDEVTIEFRIKVLSSQLENSTFLIKVSVKHDAKNAEVLSAPIRSVSKVQQIQRKKDAIQNNVVPATPSIDQLKKRKRSRAVVEDEDSSSSSPEIMEMLHQIRETQLLQLEMMERASMVQTPLIPKLGFDSSMEEDSCASPRTPSLEDAFRTFIAAYQATSASERPSKLRRLLESSDVSQAASELVVNLGQAGIQVPCSHNSEDFNTVCNCTNCPYKSQLNQLDDFYMTYLTNPVNLEQTETSI